MLSLYKIWTVAKYEMKTLLRSWFFRIFALIAIAVLTFTNVPFFALKGNTPWVFRGISASIPYYNILILNVIQAIIAVFLASDFLKRDKKLDTTEVVYMRSMNNSDYVLGKLLGILLVFLGLNLVVLMIAAVFNIFFSDVPLVFLPYLLYPIFISIPTLIFIFGLSFLSMVTIRNQAVTFILLLGYIAVTIFFLGNKFHYLFDYITFNVPLMYSDFVGFGNLALLLLHRGMYLLLGLSFVFATILLIKRLPQSVFMTRLSWILMISFLGGAIALGANYISHFTEGKKLRATITELNKTAITMPKVTLQDCRLHVQHRGRTIQVTAQLKVINKNRDP
ncbi:MAG: xanthan lyase, partial [candidate division KSB1 bacterium]|nr:xanthan lyase [candidate division KSB1 bacterium]